MTAVTMMVAVAAQIIGGNGWQSVVLVVLVVVGGVGVARVEKYNFSSSIAVSVITACHA